MRELAAKLREYARGLDGEAKLVERGGRVSDDYLWRVAQGLREIAYTQDEERHAEKVTDETV